MMFNIGAENRTGDDERGREKFPMALSLPKNRSTGNLAAARNSSTTDRSRARMSLDASAAAAAAADLEAIARYVKRDHASLNPEVASNLCWRLLTTTSSIGLPS
jgi:hypothetical protein